MNFGEQLQQLRKYKKMSQEDLAKKVGVSRQSVSKWENGVSYPEMKHIVKLCAIFHCKITDLVHGQLNDLASIDDDIKEKVVKLKIEKQKRLKKLCKIIFHISRSLKISSLLIVVMIVVCMFASPFFGENIEINENEIILKDDKIEYDETSDTYYNQEVKTPIQLEKNSEEANFFNLLVDFSSIELIIGCEILLILLLIYMMCFYWLNEEIQYLSKNILLNSTPFTLINMTYIRHITKSLFIMFICHSCIKLFIGAFIFKRLIFSIDIMQIVYILCLICLTYIFEYGYEIQLDSNGVIYNEDVI